MKNAALALAFVLAFSTIFVAVFQLTLEEKVGTAQPLEGLNYKKLYDVDLLYAYVEPGESHASFVFNFTQSSNVTLPANLGIIDVYTAKVISEGQIVDSEGVVGIQSGTINGAGSDFLDFAMSFGHFSFSKWAEVRTLHVYYTTQNHTLAKPISVCFIWMGWIVEDSSDNSTHSNLSFNQTVANVLLEKYQNGFVYNKLFSPYQLSQIDLFYPTKGTNLTWHPTSTPFQPSQSSSISREPISLFESTPAFSTALVAGCAVSIALVAVVFVHLRYRNRKVILDKMPPT